MKYGKVQNSSMEIQLYAIVHKKSIVQNVDGFTCMLRSRVRG